MDINVPEQYSRITRAGSWAFWFGIIQIVLAPLAGFLNYSAPDLSYNEKLSAAVIAIVFQLIFGGLLIIYGRKLKKSVATQDIASLDNADRFRKILFVIIVVALVLALLSSGRAGLLLFLVLLQLNWAAQASKRIRAAGTAAPAPAAPADPGQPAPVDPGSIPPVNPIS